MRAVATPEAGRRRRCIVTGDARPVDRLIRFVIAPDATATPDLEERLPGRGFWVTAERTVIQKAVDKNLFAKSARQSATAPADLADRLEALLLKRCRDRLGLARKAGLTTTGYEKTRAALKAAPVGLLIEARDASPDQAAKIRSLARDLECFRALDRVELAAALGLDNVVHGLVRPSRITEDLGREARRLSGFRGE